MNKASFKPAAPPGDMKFMSLILILFGGGLSFLMLAFRRWDYWSQPGSAMLVVLSLAALGVWFRSRVCGHLLFALFLLGIPVNWGRIVPSGWPNWWPVISVFYCVVFACAVREWLQDRPPKVN